MQKSGVCSKQRLSQHQIKPSKRFITIYIRFNAYYWSIEYYYTIETSHAAVLSEPRHIRIAWKVQGVDTFSSMQHL